MSYKIQQRRELSAKNLSKNKKKNEIEKKDLLPVVNNKFTKIFHIIVKSLSMSFVLYPNLYPKTEIIFSSTNKNIFQSKILCTYPLYTDELLTITTTAFEIRFFLLSQAHVKRGHHFMS